MSAPDAPRSAPCRTPGAALDPSLLDELTALFRDAVTGAARPLPPAARREALGRLLRAHRISALAARTYRCGDPADRFHAGLVEFHRANTARNLFGWHVLGQALDALERAAVPCVVLKGAALAPTLYDDLGLRPMSDIDLAVRPEQRDRAGEALRSAGFASLRFPSLRTDPTQGSQPVDTYAAHAGGARQEIELHWDLSQRYDPVNFRADPLERVVLETALGRSLPVLDATDTLHFLTIHLADVGNRSQRLIWYADIALLALRRGHEIDRERLVRDAKAWGTRDAVTAALSTLVGSLGLPAERVGPPAAPFLKASAARPRDLILLSVPHDRSFDQSAEDASILAAILAVPGLTGKLRVVGGMLFARPEYMRQRYGLDRAGLIRLGAAYLRRLGRAAWRALRALGGQRRS